MFKKIENRFKEIISFGLRNTQDTVQYVLSDGTEKKISMDEVKYII